MKRILALLLVLGCATGTLVAQKKTVKPRPRATARAAPRVARPERAVPFAAGETLVYDVSWSSYLTAGQAVLSVKQKRPSYGSSAYYIVAEGRPSYLLSKMYTLYYKADTLLDVYNLLPQRGSIYSEEGKRHRFKSAVFDQPRHTAKYEVRTASVSQQQLDLPPLTQDALSTLYVVRALGLKPGDRLAIPVFDSGRLYRVGLNARSVETVKAGIGALQATRIDMTVTDQKGQPAGRNLAVWISSDRRHLPVQLKADLPVGSFLLLLREARGLLPS